MLVDLVMEIKGQINWAICSGIDSSAMIATKTAKNQVVAGRCSEIRSGTNLDHTHTFGVQG